MCAQAAQPRLAVQVMQAEQVENPYNAKVCVTVLHMHDIGTFRHFHHPAQLRMMARDELTVIGHGTR